MSTSVTTSSRKRQYSSTTAHNNKAKVVDAVVADDANSSVAASWEYLLDRLRILLNRLQSTSEILQNWPETKGDNTAIGNSAHAETSAALIASIRKIALGVRGVERHVNGTGDGGTVGGGGEGGGGGGMGGSASSLSTEEFRNSLERDCPVPLDLLDLLDVGMPTFGLNPQCYARGLMVEALRQLSILERRKRALNMLANAIEGGMAKLDGDVVVDADAVAAAADDAPDRSSDVARGGGGEEDERSVTSPQQRK